MRLSSRALALLGAAALAALGVAGCANTPGGSSAAGSSTLVVAGNTLAIVISEPSDFKVNPVAQDVVHAEQLAWNGHHGEVTKYKLALLKARGPQLSDNARSAIQLPATIAYLGEIAPGTSDQTAGILNAQGILTLSATDTALELNQATPAVPGAPNNLFQAFSTYGHTFARVVPTSDQEATAQAAEMSQMKVSSLYVGDDGTDYGLAVADAVRTAARKAGLTLTHDQTTAGAIFYGATSPTQGATFFNHAASSNPSAKLFGTSSLDVPAFTGALSSAVKNVYVTSPGFMPKDLSADGKGFDKAFDKAFGHQPNPQAIFGFEAMTALLNALHKLRGAANNRTDVVEQFLRTKEQSSVLGAYSIKSDGNTTLDAFVWNKLIGGSLVPFKAAS